MCDGCKEMRELSIGCDNALIPLLKKYLYINFSPFCKNQFFVIKAKKCVVSVDWNM